MLLILKCIKKKNKAGAGKYTLSIHKWQLPLSKKVGGNLLVKKKKKDENPKLAKIFGIR